MDDDYHEYRFIDATQLNHVQVKVLAGWEHIDIVVPEIETIVESQDVPIYESVDELDKHLPPTVSLLTNERGSKVYVIGAHHFNNGTEKDISLIIRNVRPNVVMVQMCYQRPGILVHSRQVPPKRIILFIYITIGDILRYLGLFSGWTYILDSNERSFIMQDMGMLGGIDFRHIIEELQLIPNSVLCFGDRLLSTTLRRYWFYLPFWYKVKVFWRNVFRIRRTMTGRTSDLRNRKEVLENLKQLSEWRHPVFRQVYVDERVLYACHSLAKAAEVAETLPDDKWKPVTVVGIVGLAHLPGIERHWGQVTTSNMTRLTKVPRSGILCNLFGNIVTYGIFGLIVYKTYKMAPKIATVAGVAFSNMYNQLELKEWFSIYFN